MILTPDLWWVTGLERPLPRSKVVLTVPNGVLPHVASIGWIEHLDQGTMNWDLDKKMVRLFFDTQISCSILFRFFEMNILFFKLCLFFWAVFFLGGVQCEKVVFFSWTAKGYAFFFFFVFSWWALVFFKLCGWWSFQHLSTKLPVIVGGVLFVFDSSYLVLSYRVVLCLYLQGVR